jgi:hypothetical protein
MDSYMASNGQVREVLWKALYVQDVQWYQLANNLYIMMTYGRGCNGCPRDLRNCFIMTLYDFVNGMTIFYKYSGTPVDDHFSYATTLPQGPNFPESRMVSSLISINWPSLT